VADTFRIDVGGGDRERKEFRAYTQTAIRNAPFFKAALNGDSQQAREKRVSTPSCEPNTFEAYLQYLFGGHITYRSALAAQPCELIKMWILGEFLGDNRFCQVTLDELYHHGEKAGPDAIDHLYGHTPPESHLRSYIIHLWAARYSATMIGTTFAGEQANPKDFIIDLFAHLAQSGRIVHRWYRQPPPPAPDPAIQDQADGE
jgi:hypothetical protein